MGSSPRVWGQVGCSLVGASVAGIIPTRVGTSRLYCYFQERMLGSSPRVWGQVLQILRDRHVPRIIPTRVGTSCYYPSHRQECQDHPHACGDKSVILRLLCLLIGSSPRVWGQVRNFFITSAGLGIIPTREGTSFFDNIVRLSIGDHPHACGDKVGILLISKFVMGSSPRVWGQASRSAPP